MAGLAHDKRKQEAAASSGEIERRADAAPDPSARRVATDEEFERVAQHVLARDAGVLKRLA